jgi:hypothetical protein
MPIDTFGYNGVFELSESLANKLLANEAYEKNLVGNGNGDREFIGPITTQQPDGSTNTIYLLLAKPLVLFRSHDGANTVSLTIFFSGFGVFNSSAGVTTHTAFGLPAGTGLSFAVRILNVHLNKVSGNLSVDFSSVVSSDLQFFQTSGALGPTGIGAKLAIISSQPLTDTEIQNFLPLNMTPAQLRTNITNQLSQLTQGNEIPIAAGGSASDLANFDLFLFDNKGAGGAELMLFAADGSGEGRSTDGVDFMPAATPPFQFALTLSAPVLVADINASMDMGQYYKQQGTENSATNPFGFVVVPPSGTRTFFLPQGSLASAPPPATIAAPVGGNVIATIPAGGFPAHARVQLKNLTSSVSVPFDAAPSGAATASIAAAPGDRLGLQLDAISSPDDSSLVIWRPQITFQDGSLRISFHYYKYAHPVDLEENASIDIALAPDLSQLFGLFPTVIAHDINVPWWAYLVEIVLSFAIFGIGFWTIVIAVIVAAATKPIVNAVAGSQLGQNTGSLSDQLNQRLGGVAPKDLPLFLDQVDVFSNGLMLSGHADALQLAGRTRTLVAISAGALPIGEAEFTWTVTGAVCAVVFKGRAAVPVVAAGTSAASLFWSATLDDLPPDSAFTVATVNSLPLGGTIMLWVDLGAGTFAKVLLKWPFSGFVFGLSLAVTWIAFQPRLSPSLSIANNVVATAVSVVGTGLITKTCNKYDGTLDVLTEKFFLTPETQKTPGMEQWFWDDVAVPLPPGKLTQPGGTVQIDSSPPIPGGSQRRLIVHFDQSGRADANQLPLGHSVRFVAIDAFGAQGTAAMVLGTPPCVTTFGSFGSSGSAGSGSFINPLGPDIAGLIGQIAQTLQLIQLSILSSQAAMLGSAPAANPANITAGTLAGTLGPNV